MDLKYIPFDENDAAVGCVQVLFDTKRNTLCSRVLFFYIKEGQVVLFDEAKFSVSHISNLEFKLLSMADKVVSYAYSSGISVKRSIFIADVLGVVKDDGEFKWKRFTREEKAALKGVA